MTPAQVAPASPARAPPMEVCTSGTSSATGAVLGYSCCSVSMVLLNKALAMLPAWRRHGLVLLPVALQNASALWLLLLWESSGVGGGGPKGGAHEKEETARQRPAQSIAAALRRLWAGWRRTLWCLPCSVAFVAMILTSFLALTGVSVPFVTVGKNVSNVLTAAGERLLFGRRQSRMKVGALGLMVVGALAAAWHDLDYAPAPYLWMALNCASTSAYVLMMSLLSRGGKSLPSREASIAVNNAVSLVLLLFAAASAGELSYGILVAHASELFTPWAVTLHALAGACAFLLNFATMRCIAATSGTTYAMVGAANKLPTAVLGYALWRVPMSREGLACLAVGLVSTLLYALP